MMPIYTQAVKLTSNAEAGATEAIGKNVVFTAIC